MYLSECLSGQEKIIAGFSDGAGSRMSALGFFVGAKIQVVKTNRYMMVVVVSNTFYAVDKTFAGRVVVR